MPWIEYSFELSKSYSYKDLKETLSKGFHYLHVHSHLSFMSSVSHFAVARFRKWKVSSFKMRMLNHQLSLQIFEAIQVKVAQDIFEM